MNTPPAIPDASKGAIKGPINPMTTFDHLLKKPATVVHGLAVSEIPRLRLYLCVVGIASLLAFGIVIGSFSGGMQWWAAPMKICLGQLAAALLCLPSLYVLVSISGAEEKFSAITGLLIAASTLMGVLLATFSPVIWLFAQSTDSLGFW